MRRYGECFYVADDGGIAVDLGDRYRIYHMVDGELIPDTSISNDEVNVSHVACLHKVAVDMRKSGDPSWDEIRAEFSVRMSDYVHNGSDFFDQ